MQIEYTTYSIDENQVERRSRAIIDLETQVLPPPFEALSEVLRQANQVEVKILLGGVTYRLRGTTISHRSAPSHLKLPARIPTSEKDRELFEILRSVRKRLADERGISAFQVLHDTTLASLAVYHSQSRDHFARLPGIGQQKILEYFPSFSEAIRRYAIEHHLPVNLEQEDIKEPSSSQEGGLQEKNDQ